MSNKRFLNQQVASQVFGRERGDHRVKKSSLFLTFVLVGGTHAFGNSPISHRSKHVSVAKHRNIHPTSSQCKISRVFVPNHEPFDNDLLEGIDNKNCCFTVCRSKKRSFSRIVLDQQGDACECKQTMKSNRKKA